MRNPLNFNLDASHPNSYHGASILVDLQEQISVLRQSNKCIYRENQLNITNEVCHFGFKDSKDRPIYSSVIRSLTALIVLLLLTPANFALATPTPTITLTMKDEVHDECTRQNQLIEPIVHSISKSHVNDLESFHPLIKGINCDTELEISFIGLDGEVLVISLVKNTHLISDRYKNLDLEQDKNHMFLNLHDFTSNDDHCHYHGFVNDNLNSIAAISIVNHKQINGFFHDGHNSFYIHSNTTTLKTTLTRSPQYCESNISLHPDRHRRYTDHQRRSSNSINLIKHEPFQSNSSSLYVELLIVHDHSQYLAYKSDFSNIVERTMQIVNIMNSFYRQLNIFVALVGVVFWVEEDEIQLTEDGDSTLTNFLKYRYEKLLPKYHHDNAQLITSTSFNGSVVGKALKGPICTHEHSGGVNTDHSNSPAIVAVTLAHELGHNFGMEHDDEKCKCPDEKCIMSSSSSLVHPKFWSSCSIDYLDDARKHGLLDCLKNIPQKVFGPICGNGFVEEGEDCDIGEPLPSYKRSSRSKKASSKCPKGQDCDQMFMKNPCCDAQKCKFVTNATCAQGPCCDLTKCSVYNSTEVKVCRARKTECDIEEICDGSSEFCPKDAHYHNGIECVPTSIDSQQSIIGSAGYRSRAYCYNGQCASHESQCQLLWGPSGLSSNEICYEQNVHANTSGNCGYNRTSKYYYGCELEDLMCGMLHCIHEQPGDFRRPGYGFDSSSILAVSFFVSQQSKIFCHGAIIDAGPEIRDPGLVPNGASCAENRMCLNQKCVPVDEVLYKNWCPSDCNGNGICDNFGVCHCNDGTVGSSCYQFFGPNFHLSFLLYMVIFFIPMFTLILFAINHYRRQIKIWWFLHNRKVELRNKAENQHRRIIHESGSQKITISEPIPLSHSNNANRPFYQPVMDPWAESSGDAIGGQLTKSPGYRLEPLNKSHNVNALAKTFTTNSPATNSIADPNTKKPEH